MALHNTSFESIRIDSDVHKFGFGQLSFVNPNHTTIFPLNGQAWDRNVSQRYLFPENKLM